MAQERGTMSSTNILVLLKEAALLNRLNFKHRTKPLDENNHNKYS